MSAATLPSRTVVLPTKAEYEVYRVAKAQRLASNEAARVRALTASSADAPSAARHLAWGWGGFGQLGLGHSLDVPAPVAQDQLDELHLASPIVSLAAGVWTSLACCEDGKVYSWGYGRYGGLGHGDTDNEFAPQQVVGLEQDAAAVACSNYHSLVLHRNGSVSSFGWGGFGATGQDRADVLETPRRVPGLADIASIHCSDHYSICVSRSGKIWCFGRCPGAPSSATPQEIVWSAPGMTPVVDVACGERHLLLLTASGEVYGLQSSQDDAVKDATNDALQQGHVYVYAGIPLVCATNGSTMASCIGKRSQSTAARMGQKPVLVDVGQPAGTKFVSVSASVNASCLLDENGSVWLCGRTAKDGPIAACRDSGGFKLALDSTASSEVRATSGALPPMKQAELGHAHLLCVDTAGGVWSSGRRTHGATGIVTERTARAGDERGSPARAPPGPALAAHCGADRGAAGQHILQKLKLQPIELVVVGGAFNYAVSELIGGDARDLSAYLVSGEFADLDVTLGPAGLLGRIWREGAEPQVDARVHRCIIAARCDLGVDGFLAVCADPKLELDAAGLRTILQALYSGRSLRSQLLRAAPALGAEGAEKLCAAAAKLGLSLLLSSSPSAALGDFSSALRKRKADQHAHQKELADVTLVLDDGSRMPAHRLLLSRCVYFRTLLSESWAAGSGSEVGVVPLTGISALALDVVLDTVYGLPADEWIGRMIAHDGQEELESMLTDESEHLVELLMIADRFDLPVLSKLSQRAIAAMVDSENALQLLEISAVYGAASLQESLVDFLAREILADAASDPTFNSAAVMCQRLVRGFIARRLVAKERDEELIFLGMAPAPASTDWALCRGTAPENWAPAPSGRERDPQLQDASTDPNDGAEGHMYSSSPAHPEAAVSAACERKLGALEPQLARSVQERVRALALSARSASSLMELQRAELLEMAARSQAKQRAAQTIVEAATGEARTKLQPTSSSEIVLNAPYASAVASTRTDGEGADDDDRDRDHDHGADDLFGLRTSSAERLAADLDELRSGGNLGRTTSYDPDAD